MTGEPPTPQGPARSSADGAIPPPACSRSTERQPHTRIPALRPRVRLGRLTVASLFADPQAKVDRAAEQFKLLMENR
jgi:hypothetical protein